MIKYLAVFLFLFSISFAQTDIGYLIFRDILQVSEYPGSPFSGVIINDLVLYLFIPSVFIILVVHNLTSRFFKSEKIKLLMSISFYLFIVFSGYYKLFMLLAGPYLIFLLIFVGLFLFFIGHFKLSKKQEEKIFGHSMPGSSSSSGGSGIRYLNELKEKLKEVDNEIKEQEKKVEQYQHKEEKDIDKDKPKHQVIMNDERALAGANERLYTLKDRRNQIWEEIKKVKREMGMKW